MPWARMVRSMMHTEARHASQRYVCSFGCRLWLHRLSSAEGFPAHWLHRGSLRLWQETRCVRASGAEPRGKTMTCGIFCCLGSKATWQVAEG